MFIFFVTEWQLNNLGYILHSGTFLSLFILFFSSLVLIWVGKKWERVSFYSFQKLPGFTYFSFDPRAAAAALKNCQSCMILQDARRARAKTISFLAPPSRELFYSLGTIYKLRTQLPGIRNFN